MKNHTLLIVTLFIFGSEGYSQCEPVDLILNPGFEALGGSSSYCAYGAESGQICGWEPNDAAVVSDEDSFEGNYHISFSEGTLTQTIDFIPCTDYILSLWVNTSTGKNIHASLSTSHLSPSFASINSGETNGWEKISMPFSIGQEYLGIILELYGGSRSSDEMQSVDLLELCIVEPNTTNAIRVPQDYSSIQEAVDAAIANEIILLAPGTYTVTESILVDKPIILTSEYINSGDEADVDATIITGPTTLDPLILFTENASGAACTGITFLGARKQLTFECDFMKVTYSKFLDNGSDAVSIEGGGGYIAHNYFENNGDEAIDADDSLDWLAEYNTIINPGDDGFEVRLHQNDGADREHIIRYNYISGADEDGIQLIDYDGDSGREFRIHNNIIRNSAMVGLGCTSAGNTVEDFEGSYMEEKALIYNNTFDNNNYGITGASNMLLLNNIIVNNATLGVKRLEGNSFADYNCLFNNGSDFDNVIADPDNIFVDPLLNSDYSLEADSPCIDAGDNNVSKNGLGVFIEVYLGESIDIGAIEFGSDVSGNNMAPVVSAGTNDVVLAPNNTIALTGAFTDDGIPTSNSPTILWTVDQAPAGANVTFNNPNELSTIAIFNTQGFYELRLLVDDGDKSGSDIITVAYVNDFNDTTFDISSSVFIEAEDYRYLVGGATVASNTNASEEEIVNATPGGGFAYTEHSLVSFDSGTYYIWVSASGSDSNSNEINVSFNNLLEEFSAETTANNSFDDDSWIKFTFTDIPEGVYPLRISATEEGVSWDRIFVSMDADETPMALLSNVENTTENSITLYPVPNNGKFNVAMNNTGQTEIEIFSIKGQLVYSQASEGNSSISIDTGNLGGGIYFVNINNTNGNVIKKIIISSTIN